MFRLREHFMSGLKMVFVVPLLMREQTFMSSFQ